MTVAPDLSTVALHPSLTAVLDLVQVRPDALEADVDGDLVSADSPAELRSALSRALYEQFHAGRREARQALEGQPPAREPRHPGAEAALAAGVPHATTLTTGLFVGYARDASGNDAEAVVRLPEITARLALERLLTPDPRPGEVVEVRLEAARPALSPGFFYVMGSRPITAQGEDIRRIFVHVPSMDVAVQVWPRVLRALEDAGAQYHAKVISNPADLPRRDAVVVYLHGPHEEAEAAVVQELTGLAGLGTDTSSFVDRLAPGVGAAWEPRDPRPGRNGLSYGQHRSLALASALVDHALTPGTTLHTLVVRSLLESGIDPTRPALNLL